MTDCRLTLDLDLDWKTEMAWGTEAGTGRLEQREQRCRETADRTEAEHNTMYGAVQSYQEPSDSLY